MTWQTGVDCTRCWEVPVWPFPYRHLWIGRMESGKKCGFAESLHHWVAPHQKEPFEKRSRAVLWPGSRYRKSQWQFPLSAAWLLRSRTYVGIAIFHVICVVWLISKLFWWDFEEVKSHHISKIWFMFIAMFNLCTPPLCHKIVFVA